MGASAVITWVCDGESCSERVQKSVEETGAGEIDSVLPMPDEWGFTETSEEFKIYCPRHRPVREKVERYLLPLKMKTEGVWSGTPDWSILGAWEFIVHRIVVTTGIYCDMKAVKVIDEGGKERLPDFGMFILKKGDSIEMRGGDLTALGVGGVTVIMQKVEPTKGLGGLN